MKLRMIVVGCAAAGALVNSAAAADVGYSFTTGSILSFASSSDGSAVAGTIAAQLAGTSVSGTFLYDAASPSTSSTSGGALGTRGTVYGTPTGTSHSSFSMLSGGVMGVPGGPFSFTDPRGFSVVGDNAFQGTCTPAPCTPPPLADFFGLQADPSLDSQTPHNISGFTVNVGGTNYSLYNARFFWLQGQVIAPGTTPIGDFLSSNSLLARPPGFAGRLALDFIATGNPAGAQYSVFFDGLAVSAVPEPDTYAMVMAGLGLLGFIARRRKSRS
jgi:hypothetical protein